MKMKKTLILFLCCSLLLTAVLAGCSGGGGYKNKLVGSWYFSGDDEPQFEFYSDGTCEIAYEYGTGTWDVLDGNLLKITNFYGETQTAHILGVQDGVLTIGDGGENQSVLYNTPQ